MNAKQYGRLKNQIEAEYRQKIDALNLVWKMSGGSASDLKAANGENTNRGWLTTAIREAISTFTEPFTINDIEKSISSKNANVKVRKPSIATAMFRLQENKEIELVEEGSGRRPSTYKKPHSLPK